MIEFRWLRNFKVVAGYPEPKLQYRLLFEPYLIASGDIVLRALTPEEAKWQDVPQVIDDATFIRDKLP